MRIPIVATRAVRAVPALRSLRPLRATKLPAMAAAALALALPSAVLAQTGRITGSVLNASNNSPIGVAQVRIGDTGLGMVTGDNGRFVILNVPVGTHEVVVERIGYRSERQSVQVSAEQAAVLTFRMSETALELDELVVTGTPGASSRRELGNSVGSVRAAVLDATPSQSLTEILNGQTTGIQQWRNEGQVGGGSKIVLRGINSISQDVQPLIYVDGIRMNNNQGIYNNRSSINPGPAGAQTSPNPLDLIDPSNIERVEVVRGAAATTLYGTEAAGGVIQIFTKQGRAGQEATWTAEMTAGTRFMTANSMGPILGNTDDWGFTKPWYSNGPLGEAKLSVSGGTNAISYFVSAGMNVEDGVIDNNDDRVYSVRGNFRMQPTSSVNIQLNSAYTHRNTNYMEMGDNATGFMLNVLRGTQDYTNAAVDRDNYQGDPDQILFDITNSGRVEHFVGGLTTTHRADGLGVTTRLTVGLDYTTAFNQQNFPFDHVLRPRGRRNLNEWEHRTITFDLGTTWEYDIGDNLSSSFSAGGQIFSDWDHTVYGFSEDFGGPGEKTLTSGATTTSSEDLLKVVNAGFFAQEVLGIRDNLFLTAGVRVDGNSAFGESLGLQVYPKFSTSYVVSDAGLLAQRLLAGHEAAGGVGTVRQGARRLRRRAHVEPGGRLRGAGRRHTGQPGQPRPGPRALFGAGARLRGQPLRRPRRRRRQLVQQRHQRRAHARHRGALGRLPQFAAQERGRVQELGHRGGAERRSGLAAERAVGGHGPPVHHQQRSREPGRGPRILPGLGIDSWPVGARRLPDRVALGRLRVESGRHRRPRHRGQPLLRPGLPDPHH